MVYLYSIISGFRAILGSIAIQAAMALSLLFFVTIPRDAYLNAEPEQGANASMESTLRLLYWQMFAAHVASFIVMVFSQFVSTAYFNWLQVASVGAMAFNVWNISMVCDQMIFEGSNDITMSVSYDQFKHWLQTEVLVFAAGIFANIIFLFIRAFMPERIQLAETKLLKGEQTDYLEAQSVLSGLFATFVVPNALLSFIYWKCVEDPTLADDPAKAESELYWKFALTQSISMGVMIFIPMFRCSFYPPQDEKWATYVPFLHALLALLTFIVIPVFVIIHSLVVSDAVSTSAYRSSLWIYCFTSSVLLLYDFPFLLLDVISQAVKEYKMLKRGRAIRAQIQNPGDWAVESQIPEIAQWITELANEYKVRNAKLAAQQAAKQVVTEAPKQVAPEVAEPAEGNEANKPADDEVNEPAEGEQPE